MKVIKMCESGACVLLWKIDLIEGGVEVGEGNVVKMLLFYKSGVVITHGKDEEFARGKEWGYGRGSKREAFLDCREKRCDRRGGWSIEVSESQRE